MIKTVDNHYSVGVLWLIPHGTSKDIGGLPEAAPRPGYSSPGRVARSSTTRRDFAADSLQVQRRAIADIISGCDRQQVKGRRCSRADLGSPRTCACLVLNH